MKCREGRVKQEKNKKREEERKGGLWAVGVSEEERR